MIQRLVITNFNKRFTGVSATINTLVPLMAQEFDLRFVGQRLPQAPLPISYREALRFSRSGPGKAIWHVRRNSEMQAALFARDVLRAPIVLVFTSAAQRRHSAFPRWLISRMNVVIATTKEAASFVPHVAAVIPHGVDCDLFHPAVDRQSSWRSLGFGGDEGIAIVGRIRPEKGTDRFVEMAIRLAGARPGLRALIIGRTAPEHAGFEAALRKQIAEAGLSGQILFIGERPADTMPDLMRGLSLLIAPPRYEGYGLTPLEAMASAVPVIASEAGYFRSFIDPGRSGYVVPGGDPAAMAEHAAALLGNRQLLEAFGAASCQRAEALFSAEAEAAAIMAVYRSLA